jgi:hypothetical protein
MKFFKINESKKIKDFMLTSIEVVCEAGFEKVVNVSKTTLETSEEDVDKTTLETSEGDVDKTTLETSE